MTTICTLKDVSFSYHKKEVLLDVNIAITKGEFISMVGPNGGGKTTLIKLILGLEKPSKGEILLFGEKPEKTRFKVGYMPQHTDFNPSFPITVEEVVRMGTINANENINEKNTVLAAMNEMEVQHLAQKRFTELSGGQRQRVLIARALCANPEFLILDEPTAHVDPALSEKLFDKLQKLNERMTILIVSHDLGFVSQRVKSVICVNKKVAVHPTSELDGTLIKELYGYDLSLVRHDHRCVDNTHPHEHKRTENEND